MVSSTFQLDHDYFEQVILYKVLTDEMYLATIVEHLDPTYFKDKNKQSVITLIADFYKKRGTVPTIPELKSYLTTPELKSSFKAVVREFEQFNKKLNEDELYENTENFLKEKAVAAAMWKIIEEKEKGKIDSSQILQMMEKACSLSLLKDLGFDYFNKIDQHIADINRVDAYISTGWKWLDKKLGGGLLQDGRALYVFAGQPNIGKSIFLGNIAVNVAEQGKTVVVITLEMPEQIYARRVSAKLSKIPVHSFPKVSSDLKDKLYTYKVKHPNSRLIIKEFPPATITPIQLNTYFKKLKQIGVIPDLIVLDYLNLLTTTIGNNSYEKIKHISEQVRALTYIYKCPIISATQLNRTGVNQTEPGIETTSESMGTPATADVMVSVWQEDEDYELGIIKMSFVKNRFGPNFGTCIMRIDYPTLSLTEEEHSNETDEMISTTQILNNLTLL
jgi:replicative DNA helicase